VSMMTTSASIEDSAPGTVAERASLRRVARVLWWGVLLTAIGLFALSLPAQYTLLTQPCHDVVCSSGQLSAASQHALSGLGWSPQVYAGYLVGLQVVLAAGYCIPGIIIFVRRRQDSLATVISLALITFGTITESQVGVVALDLPAWHASVILMALLSATCFVLFLFLFPDGRFVPRWAVLFASAWILRDACHQLWPGSRADVATWSVPLQLLCVAVLFLSVIGSHLLKYRRVASPQQRVQTKWVVWGIICALAVTWAANLVVVLATMHSTTVGALAIVLGDAVQTLALLIIPATLIIALWRYHLWDITLLLNRALVYGLLSAGIVGLYIIVVGGLSLLVRQQPNLLVTLVGTGCVAILLHALRERLQGGINRLLYGQRDDPYAVLAALGQRLGATLAPEVVYPTIVETIATALKLPYAALTLRGDEMMLPAASVGTRINDELLCLPLRYQDEIVGELCLAPRGPREGFTRADRHLLAQVAHEAGIAVHHVRLATDLHTLNQALHASRLRLVTAREEERRRLRNDLHDGLGAALTGISYKLAAVQNVIERDPVAASQLVSEVRQQVGATMIDIRRLVYDLRPPALDDLGLAETLRESIGRFALNGTLVQCHIDRPLPRLPAALEVAVYRITMEALANVTRHAQAQTCRVCLNATDDLIEVEISDDGIGLPQPLHPGVGLASMRARTEELGGTLMLTSPPGGGTRVKVCIPWQEVQA
jgi:signal transduction histidine kinase